MDINCLERGTTRSHSICGLQQYPYEERLILLDLYPLDLRYLRGDLTLTFRLFTENQVGNFFTLVGEPLLRGHDKKILKTHYRTSVRRRSFAVWVTQPWNDLPQDIVSAASLAFFKTRLDCFLGLTKWNAIISSLLFTLLYIYMLLFSNSYIRVQCYTTFFVHICYRLTLIRSIQTPNGRTGNFGPKPCNPSIYRWIAESQFAYRSKYSTLDAVASLVHFIASSLDKKIFVRLWFPDFSNAFNTLDRNTLFTASVERVPIFNLILVEWLLFGLQTICCPRGQMFFSFDWNSCVLLGAILSPFLFSFYISDMPHPDYPAFFIYTDDI